MIATYRVWFKKWIWSHTAEMVIFTFSILCNGRFFRNDASGQLSGDSHDFGAVACEWEVIGTIIEIHHSRLITVLN
jgi:hypothetical protein